MTSGPEGGCSAVPQGLGAGQWGPVGAVSGTCGSCTFCFETEAAKQQETGLPSQEKLDKSNPLRTKIQILVFGWSSWFAGSTGVWGSGSLVWVSVRGARGLESAQGQLLLVFPGCWGICQGKYGMFCKKMQNDINSLQYQ